MHEYVYETGSGERVAKQRGHSGEVGVHELRTDTIWNDRVSSSDKHPFKRSRDREIGERDGAEFFREANLEAHRQCIGHISEAYAIGRRYQGRRKIWKFRRQVYRNWSCSGNWLPRIQQFSQCSR